MKNLKINFYFPVIILSLIVGFFLGRITNENGRYSYEHKNNQLAIFDSKTGKIYVKDGTATKAKYFVIDAINGEVENYKPKVNK